MPADRLDRDQVAAGLVANFLPIRFIGQTFRAGVQPFESPEQLNSLREELKGTHVVRREDDLVICARLSPEAKEVGTPETFSIREHRPLTMRLVREALIREVLAMNYKLYKFTRPGFVSRFPQHDLLAASAGEHGQALAGLHVYPQYTLDARTSGPGQQPGIIVGLKTRYEIDLNVAVLRQHGLDPVGRYVLAVTGDVPSNPDLDEHVYRRLVGAVESVGNGRLHLIDARGMTEVDADLAWFEVRRDTFGDAIAVMTGGRHADVLARLEEAKLSLTGGDGRLERITALARRLADGGSLKIVDGIEAEVDYPVCSRSPRPGRRRLTSTRFGQPSYVFDPAGDKTDRSAEKGLAEFGPFDSEFFTPQHPRIMVLTPQAFQGSVEVFMDCFRRGVRGGKVYTQGFARKYRLSDCDVQVVPFDAGPRDAAAYRSACLSAVQRHGRPNLAIVVTSQKQEDLQGDQSPYLVAKSTLMGQGVPVQEVQVETIRMGNPAYPLDSMALACYAKLGGIPFVIAAPRTIAHELVIGIGSSHVKPSRFGNPERIVGITAVFNADGNYILSTTSRESDYEQYPEELLRALRTCIEEMKSRNAWQAGDAIRLIFHVFKPLKDAEAGAVKQLVEGLLAEFRNVEFAFLHVSEEHEWMLIDTDSRGVGDWRLPSGKKRARGWYAPGRGQAIHVSASDMLLTVTGPYDLKLPTQGLPRPLLLKLNRESTFTDIEYLAGQVYRFTCLSWRRFYPSSKPITIMYSDLIASLLGRLRHVRNWNADIISTQFRTSRWFL